MDWFRVKAVEYDVKIVFVGEAYTSVTCPRCGYSSPFNRKHRGLFKCVSVVLLLMLTLWEPLTWPN
ncbi:MAG: zinc ribbon domain-containing protein [Candidatus Njordarchaeia archaeon]